MKLHLLATLAAFALIASPATRAEEASEPALTDEQQEIEDFILDEGDYLLEPEGFIFESLTFARADGGARVSEQRTLTAGVTYAFLAKCELEKCVGISLALSDEMGHLYTETNMEGEDAYFGFQPTATGTFTLDIDIFNCSENPCEVGLALYQAAEFSVPAEEP
jgi:hypothetical protein